MPLNLDNIESTFFSIDNLPELKPGMSFFEIKIPSKYILFDKIFVFSHIVPEATSARVYFQNASTNFQNATPDEYTNAKKVPYNGIGEAIKNDKMSTICFTDPGVFTGRGVTTSWYSVVNGVDVCNYMGQFLKYWLNSAGIKPHQALLFGSSAGSFGALRTATFLDEKTNVLSANGQIDRIFEFEGTTNRHDLISYYDKCFRRQSRIIPNIYLLCNYRDRNIRLNRVFVDLVSNFHYEKKGTTRPNIVLDLYDGIKGHGRPRKSNLLQKIQVAELLLKSSQDEQNFQREQEKSSQQQSLESSNDGDHEIRRERRERRKNAKTKIAIEKEKQTKKLDNKSLALEITV